MQVTMGAIGKRLAFQQYQARIRRATRRLTGSRKSLGEMRIDALRPPAPAARVF
jgi:hypothetical protein